MRNVYMRWMLDVDNISQQSDKVSVKVIQYIYVHAIKSITQFYVIRLNVISL